MNNRCANFTYFAKISTKTMIIYNSKSKMKILFIPNIFILTKIKTPISQTLSI